MPEKEFRKLLNQFSLAVRDCRAVYLDGAKIIIDEHPHLLDQSPTMFLGMMDELHRGLLTKLYIHICGYNQVFSSGEEIMGQMLILHNWNQEVSAAQVRDSVNHFRRQADTLKWTSLVRPFKQIAPLQSLIPKLETCVMRIGNLMAKADGNASMLEIEELKSIQCEILTYLSVQSSVASSLQSNSTDQAESSHQAIRHVCNEGQLLQQNSVGAAFKQKQSIYESAGFGRASDAGEQVEDLEIIEASPAEQSGDTSPKSTNRKNADTKSTDARSKAKSKAKSKTERQQKIDEAIDELQSLTGLSGIKEEVRSLTNLLKVQSMRREKGLPETRVSLHMVFKGNPGTGKTTVARIVGKIFGSLEVLQKGHVIETDRSGLVAEFAGQTGPKTNKVIDSALDGILFIDEAYSLIAEGTGGDPYGQEAVQTLLKRMEDDRDRLVVIMAGYPNEMDRLLKSNPGLSSRIGRRLRFEDYQPQELGAIFGSMCDANHYLIDGVVQAKVIAGLNWLFENRDRHFGNGRLVRNVFEHAIRQLANRVVEELAITEELLTRFKNEDICFERVPAEIVAADSLESSRFEINCAHCDASARVQARTLGRRVRCRKCEQRFIAKWGTVASQ